MSDELTTTFNGFVATTQDALMLFQGVLSGHLQAVDRRPHDRERKHLIRSGSVFIFNETSSGIKRWTDGISWSPSRIMGNFLVYRQLNSKGDKKKSRSGSDSETDESLSSTPLKTEATVLGRLPPSPPSHSYNYDNGINTSDRALFGSLIDSYGFSHDGLIKKTMSVTVDGKAYHMVSYYRPNEVREGLLVVPSQVDGIKDIQVSDELINNQNFRVPLEPAPSRPYYSYGAAPASASATFPSSYSLTHNNSSGSTSSNYEPANTYSGYTGYSNSLGFQSHYHDYYEGQPRENDYPQYHYVYQPMYGATPAQYDPRRYPDMARSVPMSVTHSAPVQPHHEAPVYPQYF